MGPLPLCPYVLLSLVRVVLVGVFPLDLILCDDVVTGGVALDVLGPAVGVSVKRGGCSASIPRILSPD